MIETPEHAVWRAAIAEQVELWLEQQKEKADASRPLAA